MNTLYFVFNDFKTTPRIFTFEKHTPINILLKDYDIPGEMVGDTKYISLEDQSLTNIMQIVVDDYSKKILEIKVILSNQISFHQSIFNYKSYLTLPLCVTAELTKGSFTKWEKFLPNIDYSAKIHIFKDSIIILISEYLCPHYIIMEDNFGVFTDTNFNIIGFLIRNISITTYQFLETYCINRKSKYPNQQSLFSFNKCETTIMKHKNYLIKKIIELENVNHWKVLYYGLERGLINNQFIIDYCYVLLEQKKFSDQFVLDIAALTDKDEIYNIQQRIVKKIDNPDEILITNGKFYNKVWFYLSLAADMCAEKIIK